MTAIEYGAIGIYDFPHYQWHAVQETGEIIRYSTPRHRTDRPDRHPPVPGTFWQAVAMPTLYLSQDANADRLLVEDPLALLIGMLLDQQVPMEKAFVGPYRLAERLGVTRLDATTIAAHDPDAFVEIFATPPALHRFPAAMAQRTQALAAAIRDDYAGDAAAVWRGATSGADLVKRLGKLPGFGKQKAQIFAALLGKRLGVQPPGWREAAGPYGEEGVYRSVADITDDASLGRVREYKKQAKAAAKQDR